MEKRLRRFQFQFGSRIDLPLIPWCFGFHRSFLTKVIPWCFECFLLFFFQDFSGFRTGENSLVFWAVFLGFFQKTKDQSRFLGRGCDEALFSEKRGFQ